MQSDAATRLEIVAFLKRRFGSIALLIYGGGAADAQSVGQAPWLTAFRSMKRAPYVAPSAAPETCSMLSHARVYSVAVHSNGVRKSACMAARDG